MACAGSSNKKSPVLKVLKSFFAFILIKLSYVFEDFKQILLEFNSFKPSYTWLHLVALKDPAWQVSKKFSCIFRNSLRLFPSKGRTAVSWARTAIRTDFPFPGVREKQHAVFRITF